MPILAFSDVLTALGISDTVTDKQRSLIQMIMPLAEGAVRDYIKYDPCYKLHTEYYPERDIFNGDLGSDLYLDKIGDRAVVMAEGELSPVIQLAHLPVREMVSVYEDPGARGGQGSDDFASGTQLISGSDFQLDYLRDGYSQSGFLFRIGKGWSGRRRSVKVIYYAGYTDAELDGTAEAGIDAQGLKYAALIAATSAYTEISAWQKGGSGVGPLRSESITTSGHSRTYAGDSTMLASVGFQVRLPTKAQYLAQPFRRYP